MPCDCTDVHIEITYLDRDKPIPNKLYFIGEREYQIIHTRLRNKCSSLNSDLFQKNLVASPLCQCGGIGN